MKLSFLGASKTVTGSKFLLESGDSRILIDCGLFQGLKDLRLKNWEDFPIPPDSIDAVVLTHAHLDHSGYLPRLMTLGFKGKIYTTGPTKELCRILLRDSGFLQEEEARYRNKSKTTKHNPALPLYTQEDAERCLDFFETVPLETKQEVGPFTIEYFDAGHILGAASVRIEAEGKSICFSGDLGRYDDILMTAPKACPASDYVVMESTYGDRNHPDDDVVEIVAGILKELLPSKGVLLVPAFAVGRAQVLLFIIHQVFKKHPELKVPVFLNSPMATNVTEVFKEHTEEHKLTPDRCSEVCDVAEYVHTAAESEALNHRKGPMVIISASGMLAGGRILHHLKAFGGDSKNAILLVGFQAPGTRGEALLSGAKELKIHGAPRAMRAKLHHTDALSAHGDQGDLLQWLEGAKTNGPQKVFLVHGEEEASEALKQKIEEQLELNVHIPELGEVLEL